MNGIPTEPHWAIIRSSRIFVPGDQRSREAPGHGYPEHYEDTIEYAAYLNIEEWRLKIENLVREGKSGQFLAIHAIPQIVHLELKMTVGSGK
jgi:hypothetical protein